MVQILNKMVHLIKKYPILEIWCCHKHITQLPPSRLKFDTKLRKVFPNNLAPQLCTSHSRRENIAPKFVCSFQPIKCKQVIVLLRFLAIFGTCYSSQMPSSRLKCGKKLRNTSPSRFVSKGTAQVIVTGKIYLHRILYVKFECLFWPIKSMHSKPGFWVHFSHVFTC